MPSCSATQSARVALGFELVLAAGWRACGLDAEAGVEIYALDGESPVRESPWPRAWSPSPPDTSAYVRRCTGTCECREGEESESDRGAPTAGAMAGRKDRNRYRHRDRADVRGDNGSPKAQVRHGRGTGNKKRTLAGPCLRSLADRYVPRGGSGLAESPRTIAKIRQGYPARPAGYRQSAELCGRELEYARFRAVDRRSAQARHDLKAWAAVCGA